VEAPRVKEGVWWVGAEDKDLRIFDIVIPTTYGTTYNSYLIKGEKIALVEGVKKGFQEQLFSGIKSICRLEDIRYLIINHTEPDHSGSASDLIDLVPNITLVYSKTAKTFVENIIHREADSIVVEDGEELDLGGKTLKFISAPFLHWPDTMFTYLVEDRVLFPCDCFGAHYCGENIFNDQLKSPQSAFGSFKHYYDHIFRPFKSYVLRALEKIEHLKIDMIAPSHGPILRTDPKSYMEWYRRWSEFPISEDKERATIVYVSAYGNTQRMAKHIANGLKQKGVEVSLLDATQIDMDTIINKIEASDGVIFGTPTLNAKAPKPILDVISNLVLLNIRGKSAAVFGSYGWSGEAVIMVEEILKSIGFRIRETGLKVKLVPTPRDDKTCEEFGSKFAESLVAK
jgi:NADH oxidase (H2O-forming)